MVRFGRKKRRPQFLPQLLPPGISSSKSLERRGKQKTIHASTSAGWKQPVVGMFPNTRTRIGPSKEHLLLVGFASALPLLFFCRKKTSLQPLPKVESSPPGTTQFQLQGFASPTGFRSLPASRANQADYATTGSARQNRGNFNKVNAFGLISLASL